MPANAKRLIESLHQAKTEDRHVHELAELSRLIALALAGEDVEIARDGVPVVRLVPLEPRPPGARFLAARCSLAGEIRIGDDFEFTEAEIEEMLDL